ncbi:MAG: M12 family metallo-peptidase [Aquabacterium sp.]
MASGRVGAPSISNRPQRPITTIPLKGGCHLIKSQPQAKHNHARLIGNQSISTTEDTMDARHFARGRLLSLAGMIAGFTLSATAYAGSLTLPVTASAQADAAVTGALEKIKKEKTTKSARLVKLNLDALRDPSVEMDLRADVHANTTTRKLVERAPNSYSWFGKLNGVEGDAIIVVEGDAVEGTVRHGTSLYSVRSVGAGMHAIIEVDQTKFPADHPPFLKSTSLKPINMLADAAASGTTAIAADGMVAARPTVMDVLVAYTPAVVAAKGSVSAVNAMIQLAIDETNAGYANSKVNAQVRLARSYQVNYNESGRSYETVMNHFVGKTDGFMDDIHAQRDGAAADLGVLLFNNPAYCGLASGIGSNEASAFALVHYSCATGYYSFGHEIGHLLSARHDPDMDPSTTPYAHGHGFQNGTQWRTVMAYNCNKNTVSCPRLPYWSNPWVSYQNVATGTVDKNDNARVLNTTIPFAATFRNPNSEVLRYNGSPNSWTLLDTDPMDVNVVAGTSAMFVMTNDGSVWRYTNTWDVLDNNAKTISITAGDTVYQLRSDGVILRSTGVACSGSTCTGWQQIDSNLANKAIVAGGAVLYKQVQDGSTYRYINGAWQVIDEDSTVNAMVATPTAMYEQTRDGGVWKFTGTPYGWQLLGTDTLTKHMAAAGNSLYIIRTDGVIKKYNGTAGSWTMLDNNPKGTSIVAEGSNLYQLHSDGAVWKYTGTPCTNGSCPGWQLIDSNPATQALEAGNGSLYQVRR